MSCHAARRLLEMNENLTWILAIELLAATQGVEFRRPLKSSKTLEKSNPAGPRQNSRIRGRPVSCTGS